MTFHRRQFLRGVGTAIALPFLPSLAYATESRSERSAAAAQQAPPRLLITLFANGVNTAHWGVRSPGAALQFADTLAPLQPYAADITLLSGLRLLDDFPPVGGGPHTPKFTNFLSGGVVKASQTPQLLTSFDQVVAKRLAGQTPLDALILGTEPPQVGLTGGVPSLYYSTVSWSANDTPVLPEIDPRLAFDSLFDTSGLSRERSLLDAVSAQARSIRSTLSYEDAQKIDQYLEAVRSLEQRVTRLEAPRPADAWQPTLQKPSMERPPEGALDFQTRLTLMSEIAVLALAMDKTRVVVLLMENDTSAQTFEFIPNVQRLDMHNGISHHQGKPDILMQYQLVNRWHVERFANMVAAMRGIDEGGGRSLLDNTVCLFGSNLMDGDKHDASTLPLLIAGGSSWGLRGNRHLDYTAKSNEERRLCNLYTSLGTVFGLPAQPFSNATGLLSEVLG